MNKEPTFIEFIRHICQRPAMYTYKGSFTGVSAFIGGYCAGSKDSPLSGENWRIFNRYVCLKNSFPSNYGWEYVIECCSENDDEAIVMTQNIILEFIELQKKMSENELMDYAIENAIIEEGEAEEVFRKFDKALLLGDETLIKPLIEKHVDAGILWDGSCPTDVAGMLEEMSDVQPIKRIFESDDGNQIRLIASGWPFPIEMNLKNGNWLVNAKDIIEIRKSNGKTE